jgi:hypothetical protein
VDVDLLFRVIMMLARIPWDFVGTRGQRRDVMTVKNRPCVIGPNWENAY